MGRSSTARERLVDAARDLMHSRGYGSIGVAEICARADVRKGSFYHFFESKQALTVAAVDMYWSNQRIAWNLELESAEPALVRLERIVRAMAEAQRLSRAAAGSVNGCLLANLALELSAQDDAVQARLAAVFDEQIEIIQAALEDAAAEGAIPPASARRTTARAVVAQLEGQILFAKLANDPDVLDDVWPQALKLIGASEPEATKTNGATSATDPAGSRASRHRASTGAKKGGTD